ncbi:MAG: hypothetical protein ACT4OG_02205 [Alphaproteobacteria bacterium]
MSATRNWKTVSSDFRALIWGLALAAIGVISIAAATLSPSVAQTATLSVAQTQMVEEVLASAVDSASAQSYSSDAAKQEALAAAVATVVMQQVAILGGQYAGEITSIAVALLQEKGVPESTIAWALGRAASMLAATNLDAAIAIGQTVANEGTATMAQQFAAAVAYYEGPQAVADAALAPPVATSTTGGAIGTTTGTSSPQVGGGAPPCPNPSCT